MKTLSIFVLLCSLIFNLTASNVIREDENETVDANNEAICIKPGCIKAAEIIQSNLDQSVEPCDDFYKFACGGFVKRTVVPNDKSRLSYFDIIGDRILAQLKGILEEPSSSNEPKPFSDLKKFYKVCVDTKAIEEDGLKTIKSVLRKLGGWPVLEGTEWNEDAFEWKDVLYKFRKIGLPYNGMFDMSVEINALETSKLIIKIDQMDPVAGRENIMQGLDTEVFKAYYNYLVDVAIILGADKSSAEKDIKDALDFEISLTKIGLSREERLNVTVLTNHMTVEEMREKFPGISWQEFLDNLADDPTLQILPSTVVNVVVPDYLVRMQQLLEKTSKRVQANYLLYRSLLVSVKYLTQELRDRELQFSKIESGISEHKPRWKECTELVSLKLRFAAGGLYVRRYFGEDAKNIAEELVRNLKETFVEMIKQVDWMDENTKKEALDKAIAMKAHVGYQSELLDDEILTKYFSKLNTTADNFLEVGLAVQKFLEDTNFEELQQPFNSSSWIHRSFVASVDAYYSPLENSLQLPAGILQSPLFSDDRPNYMNYGSIGFAIGHEITHGFDDGGSQYSKDGTARNWWAEKTKEAFIEKAQCIIDQYGNFTAPEVNKNLNGVITLGENIADNGGVKEAYLAYGKWIKDNGEEPRLPNLKYSSKQLFWISTANLWCTKMKTEYLEQQILSNVHAPPNFRVIGSLRNSELFAKDFECPLGSKMNPTHKCQVW